jgi:malate dehydrogenase
VKITIVGGGGGVGSSTAFNLLLLGEGYEVVLVDSREHMVVSHVMDLEQVLERGGKGTIRGGSNDDVADADVLVVTAAAPLTVNTSRLSYLLDNAEIISEISDLLSESWPGVLLRVTNPVDPLCAWLQRRTGIERTRVVGYPLNDSLRLRSGIAAAVGAAAGSIDAWVLGEHGDMLVPLLDRVAVEGDSAELTPGQRAEAEEFLRGWYVRHVALDSGRSSTWTSGLGLARMILAILADSGERWAASIVLDGEFGLRDVALTVPVSLGRDGVRHVLEWPLSDEEQAALARSAEVVRDALGRIEPALGART